MMPVFTPPQVIGTLPWVVNPTGLAAANPTPAALPAQNLQLQTVTPQLLLNAQGQVIATLASSTIQTAAIKKTSAPEPPIKNEVSLGHRVSSQTPFPAAVRMAMCYRNISRPKATNLWLLPEA